MILREREKTCAPTGWQETPRESIDNQRGESACLFGQLKIHVFLYFCYWEFFDYFLAQISLTTTGIWQYHTISIENDKESNSKIHRHWIQSKKMMKDETLVVVDSFWSTVGTQSAPNLSPTIKSTLPLILSQLKSRCITCVCVCLSCVFRAEWESTGTTGACGYIATDNTHVATQLALRRPTLSIYLKALSLSLCLSLAGLQYRSERSIHSDHFHLRNT